MTAPTNFKLIQQPPDHTKTVLIPFFQSTADISSWTSFPVPASFTGKRDQWFQVYDSEKAMNVLVLGLGEQKTFSTVHQVFHRFLVQLKDQLVDGILVDLSHLDPSVVYHCVLGIDSSQYAIGAYKTESQDKVGIGTIELLVKDANQDLIREAQHTAAVVNRIRYLVDAPANVKTPQFLADWALESASEHGYRVEIFEHQQLKQENLHALMAVGQGSENPPVLIKAQYNHPDRNSGTDLGLVGKGVTFDTGGLSLKKPNNMHYMKSDMGGAAAVLGAMELIARLRLPISVTAVIPVAENSVDAHSFRPGDVISSYSGKTIEVIDTDAEGRLILADALTFIQSNYHPKTLVDLATLTGSCVAALGYEAAGLFSNDQHLIQTLIEAGDQTGERVWNLPLWESYADALHSDIADVKNLSGKPVAGAITAAKFLEYFVDEDQVWAHLDIAGVAFGDTDHAKMKSATGYGVRLLVELAKSLIGK